MAWFIIQLALKLIETNYHKTQLSKVWQWIKKCSWTFKIQLNANALKFDMYFDILKF